VAEDQPKDVVCLLDDVGLAARWSEWLALDEHSRIEQRARPGGFSASYRDDEASAPWRPCWKRAPVLLLDEHRPAARWRSHPSPRHLPNGSGARWAKDALIPQCALCELLEGACTRA
jgi:hypothetical protein